MPSEQFSDAFGLPKPSSSSIPRESDSAFSRDPNSVAPHGRGGPRPVAQLFARSHLDGPAEGASDAGFGPHTDGESTADAAAAADGGPRPKRRRGSRGGRRRRSRARGPGSPDALTAGNTETIDPDDAAARLDDGPPDDDDRTLQPQLESAGSAVVAEVPSDDGGGGRSRRGRRRRGKRGGQKAPSVGSAQELPRADDTFRSSSESSSAERSDDDSGNVPHASEHDLGSFRADDDGEVSGSFATHGAASTLLPAPKRRRRGSRGGRGRKRETALPVEVEAIPGEEDDLPDLPDLPAEAEVVEIERAEPARRAGRQESSRKKSRRRDKGGRDAVERESSERDDEHPTVVAPARKTLILVNAADPEEQRVAVVEGETITDFQMTVKSQNSVVNDIYRGRVVNLEPAIGAAFVDFGQGRNGFLHTSDVISAYGEKDWSIDKLLTTNVDPDEWESDVSSPTVAEEILEVDPRDDGAEGSTPDAKRRHKARAEHTRRFRARPRLPITDLLRKGETVVVQVTKDAIGDKGPTLTTYISIPGRYLVLMPCMSRTGVSRKIEDEKERRRLKKILQQLEVPPSMGVIVRTAGVGHSKADLKRDLDYLKGVWESFSARLKSGHGPAPLYQESDVAIRTVRDLFTPETEAVVVDDPEVHRQIVDFTRQLMPENVERVKLYTGPRPLFHSYGVEGDFEKVFARRIELPSGGSIVFDQAEALVAIDVNSGRTRTDGFDFEEIALKANLDAAPEIARQIRLRDLGGIIVVDFIDMMRIANIRTVERVFKEALANDRARSKVGRISQFGLLELTRQRLGPGINKKAFHTCPRCRGLGRIRTVESRAAAILRRLGSAMSLKGFSTVEVRAHPEVVAYLRDACSDFLRALEYRFEREIKLLDAPEQVEDSVLRYLRTDGREVRPGGRRKR